VGRSFGDTWFQGLLWPATDVSDWGATFHADGGDCVRE